MEAPRSCAIYFHRDFDGMVSCALIADFVKSKWPKSRIKLFPVSYNFKEKWTEMELKGDVNFVLDFLFHPKATYWFDHHKTGLIDPNLSLNKEHHFFDPTETSCAMLIWKTLYEIFNYRNLEFQNLVHWADKIDSGNVSIEDQIALNHKALEIHLSLGIEGDNMYLIELCRLFINYKDLILSPRTPLPLIVEWRVQKAKNRRNVVLAQFRKASFYDKDSKIVSFSMYQDFLLCKWAPFYVYPECNYVVGILRMEAGHYMVIVNASPLSDEGMDLHIGEMCSKYGGGGHRRVGAINVKTEDEAKKISEEIMLILKEGTKNNQDHQSLERGQ